MAKALTLLRKDEKSSSEEEERRKEEGSAVSGLYHHPPSSSERARSFPRSAHFPRIRAIAIQGRGFPCGHRRFGVRRTWRVRVAGRQADDARTFVLYASRLVAIFCGNCRLLLLELLPPSFCTTHSARPPAPPKIHISHVHLPPQRHAPRRLLFLPPPALRSSHQDPPPRKLLRRASIPRPSPTCTDPARRLKTRDLQLMFKEWDNDKGGYRIKWLDDTNALVVFADAIVGVSGSIPFVV